ncbi:hypothetical protein PFICI_10248 [Pestalotiopsis fici W106-1]|uniref:Uncharacterized protein n=1 Tax=Pestalotiopsis fici (strain W106-1 / CGMCC3.15140) TaxID=1229662 RepID=W3WZ72_PESFW|nr:uncharacterized protein PFICI_10248 [Pestalotiopsis fici W106-1]ETS78186.1 hypothetical protein PFICI_10248 [Pestalotiopsis fici W106-1]
MSDENGPVPAREFWFSSDEGPLGWRLDVVTLLAVIGESSIADHAQAITASMLCLLPRIIPAPQALLKGTRPARMPETAAKITGVYSGVTLDSVGFFANIIHPLDEFAPFGFKVLKITHNDENEAGDIEMPKAGSRGIGRFFGRRTNTSKSDFAMRRLPRGPSSESNGDFGAATTTSYDRADVESQAPPNPGIIRRQTVKQRMTGFIANPTLANNAKRPAVPAALWSPVHILSIFSMCLTFAIIGFAAHYRDGTAILAVALISVASSITGAASWWRPLLMRRSHTNKVPKGDVVIRTREGAFLLIKCTENVARELYAGTEECEYRVGGQWYKVLMGFGTFLLMVSVILLGNCKWNSQLFIGGSYISLNGMYWVMGLLPKKYFWDLSRYHIQDITPKDALNAHDITDKDDPREGFKSFTRTLWWCIRETKHTAWVERSGAAPSTPQWRAWLDEAETAAESGNRTWPSIGRKDDLMRMTEDQLKEEREQQRRHGDSREQHRPDPAEQIAPASQVQPSEQRRDPGAF